MPRSLYGDIFRLPSRNEVRDFLLTIPLFEKLRRREVSHLAQLMYKRQFNKGEVVFVEGDIGSAMYIIVEGKVSIVKTKGKQMNEVACLTAGSFFGEMALLTDQRRSATAKVSQKATLLCFFKKDLEHILRKHPDMGMRVLRNLSTVLAKRLQHAISLQDEQ